MDSLVVATVVLVAAAFIGRRVWSTVRAARDAKAGCSDCGCGSTKPSAGDWSKS